jgi:plasmid replication initiation protein
MGNTYPKVEGPLLDAVLRAQKLTGGSDQTWQARRDAEAEIVRLCPIAVGSVATGRRSTFDGRKFRIRSIEVRSAPHYASYTMFDHGSVEWYWVLRGPLLRKDGTESEVNEVTSFETFHVHIPECQPIPGDAGW